MIGIIEVYGSMLLRALGQTLLLTLLSLLFAMVIGMIFGLMNVVALCLFLLVPGVHFWVDALAMILFGLGIGVLICFLGGLMAVDIAKDGKPVKWMVENSWGAGAGYKGHLIMTDRWFDEYMFRLVVEKKFATAKVLDILKQKPIRLPAWDPMFAPEE